MVLPDLQDSRALLGPDLRDSRALLGPDLRDSRALLGPDLRDSRALLGPDLRDSRALLGPDLRDSRALLGPDLRDSRALLGPDLRDCRTLLGPDLRDSRALLGPDLQDSRALLGPESMMLCFCCIYINHSLCLWPHPVAPVVSGMIDTTDHPFSHDLPLKKHVRVTSVCWVSSDYFTSEEVIISVRDCINVSQPTRMQLIQLLPEAK